MGICCSERMLKLFISSSVRSDCVHVDPSLKDNLGMSGFSMKAKKLSLKFMERKPDDFVASKSL